jgi:DNA-directed RNA polymerase specialized sigma24 family protein
MDHLRKLPLIDGNGEPVDTRIEGVLSRLLPRLRREFPALQDDVVLAEVLEEAARRIGSREERGGPIDRINGYAWVTIRSVATSRLRQGSARLHRQTLGSDASHLALSRVAASDASAEQIERQILLREVLAQLSSEEQLVCLWKSQGFSSREIAQRRRCTVNAVDLVFFHAKEKIRRTMGLRDPELTVTGRATEQPRGPSRPQADPSLEETDGETDTAS